MAQDEAREKMGSAKREARNAVRYEYNAPKINLFIAPLVDQVSLSSGEMRILIIGGAILAMGIGAFLALW